MQFVSQPAGITPKKPSELSKREWPLLIYLHAHETMRELKDALTTYFSFYNARRPHQSLKYQTPDEAYFATGELKKAA